MKVVCIKNIGPHVDITIDKVYDVIEQRDQIDTYYIRNDKGQVYGYIKTRFITLEEFRENKIKEILK